jgi:signal transduction histidine kinase
MAEIDVGQLLRDRRLNAALAWAVTAVVGLVAVESVLTGDLLWAVFAGVVVVLILLPPIAFRSARTMLPWEILTLATLPILGRALATFQLSSRIGTYLSVAALALIIAVELHTFTAVRMSPTFAVAFVAITTMAAAGVWAAGRWLADIWLGTGFLDALGDTEEAIERAVMLEFVASTIAGLLAGVVFEFYVRRRARIAQRIPDSVEAER